MYWILCDEMLVKYSQAIMSSSEVISITNDRYVCVCIYWYI